MSVAVPVQSGLTVNVALSVSLTKLPATFRASVPDTVPSIVALNLPIAVIGSGPTGRKRVPVSVKP
jgi:hypothetical protein